MLTILKFRGKACLQHRAAGNPTTLSSNTSTSPIAGATSQGRVLWPTSWLRDAEFWSTTAAYHVQREYCNFCGDLIQKFCSVCKVCGAFKCHQFERGSSGCVGFGSLKDGVEFRCVLCHNKVGKGPLPYEFIGYSSRRRSKLTWPMVLLTLVDSPRNSFLSAALSLDLEHQYYLQPQNLFVRRIDVGQVPAEATMAMACRFSEHSLECGWPCNTFILLQLPVDAKSGQLCTQEGAMTALQAIQCFFGSSLLGVMAKASQACLERGEPSVLSWYDASKRSRGGWRGLFLPVGGAIVRHLGALEDLKSLVERSVFDFMVGFGAASPNPQLYRRAISRIIESIGVDKTGSIWDIVLRTVGHDLTLLQSTNVICIHRDRGDVIVSCRSIACHDPAVRPWGVEFIKCATPGCQHSRHDLVFQYNRHRLRMTCRKCMWKSGWVKERDVSQYVGVLNSKLRGIFWCEYPPKEELRGVFLRAEQSGRDECPGENEPMDVSA